MRLMTLGLGPGPLGGPAHQGRSGPLGAQHTKVEVRFAHLLGMHSFDDFRVSGLELRTALITYIHIYNMKYRPRRKN